MTKGLKYGLGVIALVVLVASWSGFRLYQELNKRWSEDPLVWEADISALEKTTQTTPDLENTVVFVGSSSIRFWDTLTKDMAPITVIRQGFGGAKLNDLVHYAERIVTNYQPSAVVVFAGSNDLTPGDTKPPEQLLASYQEFVARVRAENPGLLIYYIAITPSPRRWEVWRIAQAANALIEEYINNTPGLFYLDTGPALMGDDGLPDTDNYLFDKVHLSEEGYKKWTSIIRPRLIEDLPPYAKAERRE